MGCAGSSSGVPPTQPSPGGGQPWAGPDGELHAKAWRDFKDADRVMRLAEGLHNVPRQFGFPNAPGRDWSQTNGVQGAGGVGAGFGQWRDGSQRARSGTDGGFGGPT